MCQCTLFDVGGVEIQSIEYCTKDQSNVEDVEDRSNTPKGCNAMYVDDVKDVKDRDQIHLRAVMLCISKMSKIDQIHLRAVMLCMSKMLKIIFDIFDMLQHT